MECEVNWDLGSITTHKTSGGDGIPAELFQILKEDAVKMLLSICQQIWKTQQWPQDWKIQCSFQSQRRAMLKYVQTTTQFRSISSATKVMLKILQAKLQQYVNQELQMFKLDLKNAEEQEIELPISIGS